TASLSCPSLHDALPISLDRFLALAGRAVGAPGLVRSRVRARPEAAAGTPVPGAAATSALTSGGPTTAVTHTRDVIGCSMSHRNRSEEQPSELQSLTKLV